MGAFFTLGLLSFSLGLMATCAGQESRFPLTPANSASAGLNLELDTIDAKTRWSFRSKSPVTISSSIIRLGDVAEPLDPYIGAWNRLKNAPIGLLPVGGKTMTIDRNRLNDALRNAEATPRSIDWIGPEQIEVVYRKDAVPSLAANSQSPVAQASATVPAAPLLSEREVDRIMHWIDLAIDRQIPSVHEAFRIEVDQRQPALARLRTMAGVSDIRVIGTPEEGLNRFHLRARSVDGPIEAEISATLTKHPVFAVPRSSLPRGHRIAESDLVMVPIDEEDANSAFVADPGSLIGKEVRNNVMRGKPFKPSDVGSPILVHRGDLVELQVLGGGVKVTTTAKAVGEGAESDLIEVDTLRPRKRMVARVVEPGVVAIVTRAPVVR